MCGFLTEFCFRASSTTNSERFRELLHLSKHRGPDSSGVVSDSFFQIGFNRLAILDVSSNGNQPKQSSSGRYHVVFNGEIYNFKNLAKRFNLKSANSDSDTEVLVDLIEEIGVEKAVAQLNGMFSISVIDTEKECLVMARDFAGIKPLFYGVSRDGIVTASQFDQVFKHQWFKESLRLRMDVVKEYFAFGYMQAPNTIYSSIFQVNPGDLVCVNREGDITKDTIVSFPKKIANTSYNETDLEVRIEEAVNRQLISDVPIATFLSGGVDSPLISACAKASKKTIEAFTLKVNDEWLNESDIAESYAKALKLKQHIVEVDEDRLIESIDTHFKAFSEPFGDYSSIPTYVLTKESRKKHTVMLSGDAGDELFFGYPRMLDVLRKKTWFKIPRLIRKPLIRLTNKVGITNTWSPYLNSFNDFIMNKHAHLPNGLLDNTFPEVTFSNEMSTLYTIDNKNRKETLHQLRFNEFYAHLQRVLIKVDRASMINSLEVRVPFLDRHVIEGAWTYIKDLTSKTDLKYPLKKMLSKKVPEELITKEKKGFTVPIHKWLKTDLKAEVIKIIINEKIYGEEQFNVTYLKQYVKDYYDDKHNNAWGIWHIYAWQKWAKTHLND